MSDPKHTEELLPSTDDRLSLSVQSARLGIWDWNLGTGELVWSRECGEMFGVAPGTPPSYERWLETLHPEDRQRVDRIVQSALESGSEYSADMRVVLPDGSVRWVASRGSVYFGPERRPIRMSGAVMDITQFKETEAELQRARAEAKAQADNLATILDAAPVVTLIAEDPACQKMTGNRAAYELLRLPYGSNISNSASNSAQARHRVFQNGQELRAEDFPVQLAAKAGAAVSGEEVEMRFEDGSSVYLFGNAVPLFDEAGKVRGALGAFLDFTDYKVIEERLRMATERFQIALRDTPITVFSQDLDLRYKWAYNPVGRYDVTQLIGKRDRELLENAEDAAMVEELKREVLRTGASYQGELAILVNGERHYYHVNIDPQRNHLGQIVGLTCASFDLTDRKRGEQALRESEVRYRELAENRDREIQARTRELEERTRQAMLASEGLKDLSGRLLRIQDEERRRIARELHDSAGQMLTALDLELENLAEEVQASAPQLTMKVQGAQTLVQQLYGEIRTTSHLLHPPLLDEAGLFSAVQWYVQGMRERSGLEIDLQIEEDFGRLPRDMELAVFRLVQETLTNIYRHSGSNTASIRILRDRDKVAVEVSDAGRGMSADKIVSIQSGGSGVGIRGMRERLRQFHGDLQIESSDRGTNVFATIPIPLPVMGDENAVQARAG